MTEPARGAARSAEDAPPSGRQVIAVLVGSGAIGFFMGAVAYPTWHDALEPAQVLAGLVTYPQHNLVYIYSTRTLTVLHELLALLLSSGVSERTLALLLSGAIGMLSLQALGLVVLAVSGHVQLATLSPVFILLTNATAGGVTYPVYLDHRADWRGAGALGCVAPGVRTCAPSNDWRVDDRRRRDRRRRRPPKRVALGQGRRALFSGRGRLGCSLRHFSCAWG